MRVSVIIPAYNSSHFLRQCIESVLAQSCPASEILVVDDGSTDNTREVVESYPPPVRYHWRPNGGIARARNTGVRQTTSPWVAFLDADDWWETRKIQLQKDALDRVPGAALCYTSKVFVCSDGLRFMDPAVSPDRLWPMLRYMNPIAPSSVMMRRDVFDEVGGFDAELKACEDWEFWFRLGPNRRMVAVHEPVTCYRVTPTSRSTDVDRILKGVKALVADTFVKDLRGWERWAWHRRAWSAELGRCAITARQTQSLRALALITRSLMVWPSPFFVPRRWKQLLVYLTRDMGKAIGEFAGREIHPIHRPL